MKKTIFALMLLLFTSTAYAAQGLYLTVFSYLPNTTILLDDSQCISGLNQLALGQRTYLEGDNTWGCIPYTSYADFSIIDTTTHQKLASYHLGISMTGSSIKNTFLQSPYVQANRLFPHYGLAGSQDRVRISLGPDESHWMGDLGNQIATHTLMQLYFPGTHDSGSYAIQANAALMPDAEDAVKTAYNKGFGIARNIIANWSKTQNNTIYQQLISGIRYFDLRMCGIGTSIDTISTCHGLQGATLTQVVSDVKKYLQEPNHDHEIIIMDLNHWYNTDLNNASGIQTATLNYIYKELQPWIAPRRDMNGVASVYTPATLFSTFWNNKKQLIIAARNYPVTPTTYFVWNTISTSSFPNCPNADICTRTYHELEPSDQLVDLKYYLSTLNSLPVQNYLYSISLSVSPTTATIESGLEPGATPSNLMMLNGEYIDTMTDILNTLTAYKNINGGIITEDFSNGMDLTEFAKKFIFKSKLTTTPPQKAL